MVKLYEASIHLTWQGKVAAAGLGLAAVAVIFGGHSGQTTPAEGGTHGTPAATAPARPLPVGYENCPPYNSLNGEFDCESPKVSFDAPSADSIREIGGKIIALDSHHVGHLVFAGKSLFVFAQSNEVGIKPAA